MIARQTIVPLKIAGRAVTVATVTVIQAGRAAVGAKRARRNLARIQSLDQRILVFPRIRVIVPVTKRQRRGK